MLTAKDLLYKAMDYDGFWNTSKRMLSSKPAQCRKAQLDVLLKAFGIAKSNARAQTHVPHQLREGVTVTMVYFSSRSSRSKSRLQYIKSLTDFKYFSTGEFAADTDRTKYHDFLSQIVSAAKAIFPEEANGMDSNNLDLVRLFSNLYNFRLSIFHMFKYSFGTKAADSFSIEDDYSLFLRKQFMEAANVNLSKVEEILCLLIDPEERTFGEDDISYPYYDLVALDKEWRDELRNSHSAGNKAEE